MPMAFALAATAGGGSALAADADEGWRGQITVHGRAGDGHGAVRPFRGAPFSGILGDRDAALVPTGLARRDRLVLLAAVSCASSSREGSIPPGGPASGEVSRHALTRAAGGRPIAEPGPSLDLPGGIRGRSPAAQAVGPFAGIGASRDATFVDPILAIRVMRSIAPGRTLLGHAAVGGIGAGSDPTRRITAAADLQATETTVLSAGYRHLVDDDDGGGTSFRGAMTGPPAGAARRL